MVDVMGGQLVETAGNVLALLNELKLTVAVSEHVAAQQAQDAAHAQLQQSIEHMQEQVCDWWMFFNSGCAGSGCAPSVVRRRVATAARICTHHTTHHVFPDL